MRVHHLAAPRLHTAPLQGELHLLLVGQRESVDRRALVERSGGRSLQARAVVAPDPQHDRVLELPHLLDRLQQSADVVVGVLGVPRVDLHLVREESLAVLRKRVPGGHRLVPRGQFRPLWHDPQRLLTGERLFAQLVPALVELALVPVRPLLGHVVRRVAAAGGVIEHPRLRRVVATYPVQPVDGLVGHRLGEVERLFVVAVDDTDEPLVLRDHRVVLTGLWRQEAPEVVEPPSVGPMVERSGRSLFTLRGQVPLSDARGGVPVLLQDPRERRRVPWQHRGVAGEPTRELGDATHADRMVVASGEQRSSRRRAHRGHVEPVVAQPALGHPVVVRGSDGSSEGTRVAESRIVDEDHQDVRRPRRRRGVTDQPPVRSRFAQGPPGGARELRASDGEHGAVDLVTHRCLFHDLSSAWPQERPRLFGMVIGLCRLLA